MTVAKQSLLRRDGGRDSDVWLFGKGAFCAKLTILCKFFEIMVYSVIRLHRYCSLRR